MAAGVLAALASGATSTDVYITGKVLGRVAGTNASLVEIAWDFKCLGENRGTYEWTMKVTRTQPLPRKVTTLGSGTTERGEQTVELTPGAYLPTADPYTCETSRGQGYDKPEIGGPFTVPDYCAWSVISARGAVELEHASAVKLAKPGATVAPGDALVTPAGAQAVISSQSNDGKATLAGSSQVTLDAKHCAAKGGWRFVVGAGSVAATVSPAAPAKGSYQTATANATVSGTRGASWRVDRTGKTTKVRALAGRVLVAKKGGRPKPLAAGQSTVIR